MSARYIFRLDDACPTMRREIWDPLEEELDRLNIRPIVGVIPDNRDPTMLCSEADPNFWERVRGWKKKGWGIALHGLHHTYHPIPDNCIALMPINNGKSEFVGLSLDKQREILKESWRIFNENGVKPSMFMAPSHTFDENTLRALNAETDIRIVTDGHALFPFWKDDFLWIPQQISRFHEWLPFGVWTVCQHPNTMNFEQLEFFIGQLMHFADKIIPYQESISKSNKRKGLSEWIFALIFGFSLQMKG